VDDYTKRGKIYQLQEWLLTLSRADGLPRVIPDGIYGSETREAVAVFQGKSGLEVTGVVDYATWTALYEADKSARKRGEAPLPINPFDARHEGMTIKKGDRFPTVLIIQAMLEELSGLFEYNSALELNGVYDDATEDAVKRVQGSLGMSESGIVDIATWNELAMLYDRSIGYDI